MAMLLTLGAARPAAESEWVEGPSGTVFEVREADLREELAVDGVDLTDVDVLAGDAVVEASVESSTGLQIGTETTIDLAESTGSVEVAMGEDRVQLDLVVEEFTDELLAISITDQATGDVFHYRSDEGEFAAGPALILGIPIIIAVLEKLLIAASVVVIAGATYVIATKAIEAWRKKGSDYQHFIAIRHTSGLFVGSGISLNRAIQVGRKGGDTYSRTQAGAAAVARGVKQKPPVGPERDKNGSGKYLHYHPFGRTPAMHAFFGTPN